MKIKKSKQLKTSSLTLVKSYRINKELLLNTDLDLKIQKLIFDEKIKYFNK